MRYKYTWWLVLFCCTAGCTSQNSLSKTQQKQVVFVSHPIDQTDDLSNLTAKQLKQALKTYVATVEADSVRFVRREIVAKWAAEHPPESLADDAVEWAMMEMLPEYLGDTPPQKIDAVWETEIVPPQSGDYTFHLSPLNLTNTRENGRVTYFRLWLTVDINGKTILQSRPGAWKQDSEPIHLTQDEPARVKFTVQYRLGGYPPLPAAGQLFWSGPQLEKQLIAPQYFQVPSKKDRGVLLTVKHTDQNGTSTVNTTVDSIDQILGKHAIVEHERTLGDYIEHRVEHMLSADFMADARLKATQEDVSKRSAHPLLAKGGYRGVMTKASSDVRQRVAAKLAQHPDLVAPLEVWTLVYFHDSVRFGAERSALDLVGTWTSAHADRPSELADSTRGYYEKNRKALRHFIVPLLLEHPTSAAWLEQDYLETGQGKCSIAAATILAYIHLVDGKLSSWIESLDARLEDVSLKGETRVNWLVARAIAEEIRNCKVSHVQDPDRHQLGAGFKWLTEAESLAELPSTKTLVVRERATRLAALGRFQHAANSIIGLPELDDMRDGFLEPYVAEALRLREGKTPAATLLAELKRRQARADSRGDDFASAKYAAFVRKLEHEISIQKHSAP